MTSTSEPSGDISSEPVSGPESAMTAAPPPVGVGATPLVAAVASLALIALGVLGIQEALVRAGAVTTMSWTTWSLDLVDDLEPSAWMVVPFGLLALCGLLLLLLVFRRRPRKTLTLSARTGVYLRTKDLARIIEDLLEGVEGVTDFSASASRSRLRIDVTTLEPSSSNTALVEAVRARIAPTLAALSNAPKAKIDVRNEDLA